MPRRFQARRRTRRPRFRRSTRRHPGRTNRRRGRGLRKGPSTQNTGFLMKDRDMVKFKFVSLTSSFYSGTTYPGYANQFGMLEYWTGTDHTNPEDIRNQMYVFSPNFTDSGATNGAATPAGCRLLAGNSVSLTNGLTYFSDNFTQLTPTGTQQWANFYETYICNGSSVEVTLCNCLVPGQLVVLPITCDDVSSYNYVVPAHATNNYAQLVTFKAVPDEQPYARIKYVSKTGGMDKVRIKHYMTTRKLFNIRNLQDDEANKSLLNISSNNRAGDPQANQWAWFIAYVPSLPAPSADDGAICTVQVRVTYYCTLQDRINLQYTGTTSP